MKHVEKIPKKILLLLAVIILYTYFTPVQPTSGDPEPYFQLTIIVDYLEYQNYILAQRIAPQLQRLGIDIRIDQSLSYFDRMYPEPDDPSIIPLSYDQRGYDLAMGRIGGLTLFELWNSIHTQETSTYSAPSPQLHDDELNRDLEALFGFHSSISTDEALRRIFYRLTWELVPFIPICTGTYPLIYSVATLEGFVGSYTPGDPFPSLRWGQNGLEAWSFSEGTNQSTLRLATRQRTGTGFLYYEYPYEIYMRPTEVVLNGLIVPRSLGRDLTISEYLPDLVAAVPVPVAGINHQDNQYCEVDDLRLWDLQIRSGVTWHPGYGYPAMPFTIEDVLFTYESLRDHPHWKGVIRSVFGNSSSMGLEVINATTIRFHLTDSINPVPPDGLKYFERFLWLLTWPILPRHILDPNYVSIAGPGKTADGASILPITRWNSSDFHHGYRTDNYTGPAIIGTGPYRWQGSNETVAYIPGDNKVLLTRNDAYFKDNGTLRLTTDTSTTRRPTTVKFQEFLSQVSAVDALLNGSTDVLWGWIVPYWEFSLESIQSILTNSRFNASVGGGRPIGLFLNTAHNRLPLPVRLAISHAIDRNLLAQDWNQLARDYLLQTGDAPTFQSFANPFPLPIIHPAFPTDLSTPVYDLEKAWDYMEEAGYDMSPYRSGSPKTSKSSFPVAFFVLSLVSLYFIQVRFRRSQQKTPNPSETYTFR